MLTLKWGEVLSTLLPGAVAVLAVAPAFPFLDSLIRNIDNVTVGGGVALLMASALAGGVLEAITRVTWERHFLVRFCRAPSVLHRLTPDNLELYERGVQSSYKYVTFYANFAVALLVLMGSRWLTGRRNWGNVVIFLSAAVLLHASSVQWRYYVNYITKVFDQQPLGDKTDVGQRSA